MVAKPLVSYSARGAVAVITIERPEVRNAVDQPTREALAAAFRRFDVESEHSVAILTGRGLSGEEAERIGLVNRVVEPGEALASAIRLGEELGRLPQTCLRNDRRSAIEQWELGWEAGMLNEFRLGLATFASGEGDA